MTNRFLKGAAALLFALALSVPAGAGTQRTFVSPEVAAEALVDSVARNDEAEVRAILGIIPTSCCRSTGFLPKIAWPFSMPGRKVAVS